MSEDLNDVLETKPKSTNTGTPQPSSTFKAAPISTEATGFLRLIGWAVAIVGVIASIIVLVNAPEGPSDITLKYRSDDLSVQIQRTVRLAYLSVGWGQIIGSIVIGVLLNVVAGIGNAVLDIWKAQQNKQG